MKAAEMRSAQVVQLVYTPNLIRQAQNIRHAQNMGMDLEEYVGHSVGVYSKTSSHPSFCCQIVSSQCSLEPKSLSIRERNVLVQVGSLGNAVGIGGGAFFVPLGEVLLGFSEYRQHLLKHECARWPIPAFLGLLPCVCFVGP